MNIHQILNDIDDLGARIDALTGLGAAVTAALAVEALRPTDVQNMLATYASGLLALQRKIRGDIELAAVDEPPRTPAPIAEWPPMHVPHPCQAPCPAGIPAHTAAA